MRTLFRFAVAIGIAWAWWTYHAPLNENGALLWPQFCLFFGYCCCIFFGVLWTWLKG